MKLGILVVAYNAASTLAKVLDRIPQSFRPRITNVLVYDDNSDDATYLVGLGYQSLDPGFPLTVIRHPQNLGYGGNQKAGFRWAIEHGLDAVVLLHGDGKYAPEELPAMVEPLERGECDAVFGSRMLVPGEARAGGMPLYRLFGNKVLSAFDNAMVGLELSEWHSGYRAYRVAALRDLPFETNSNGFDFDSQIIIQLHESGKRIVEIPIPTFYGGEISSVNGLTYARDTAAEAARYRLHKMGFGTGDAAFASADHELKQGEETSDGRIVSWMRGRPPARVLHLGCLDGSLSERLEKLGHEVTAVEGEELGLVRDRVHRFLEADLDEGIPRQAGTGYDVVLLSDALTRARQPELLLAQAHGVLGPRGTVVACVANFGHWYPRSRVILGAFDYDRRGILDNRSVRFYTRRSFERLAESEGYQVQRREALGLPVEVLRRGSRRAGAPTGRMGDLGPRMGSLGVALRPTLFAYQFLYELAPADRARSLTRESPLGV
jgi:glycosyltransferase involved in cell wall biosynthesis